MVQLLGHANLIGESDNIQEPWSDKKINSKLND